MYTVVDATILRSLPFREPDRLLRISQVIPPVPERPIPAEVAEDMVWSYPRYTAFREAQHSFVDLSVYRSAVFNLTNTEQPERLSGEIVSGSYFRVLGVEPEAGRTFLPEEDAVPERDFVVLLSHRLWAGRYGGDRLILGKTITLGRRKYTVVGVLPPSFQSLSGPADVWVPAHTLSARELGEPFSFSWQQVGRLKPGITVEQAKKETALLGPRIEAATSAGPDPFLRGWGVKARTLNEARLDPLIRRGILVLFGAVVCVLLIACVNLALLVLARGSTRGREIAIRAAIGASRSQLIRYLLTESLLIAVLGGAVGLGLAYLSVNWVRLIKPEVFTFGRPLPGLTLLGLGSIHLDARAVIFTLGAVVATGSLFGIAPALQGSRVNLSGELKRVGESQVGWTGTRMFAGRNLLVVLQVALATVLLAAAGLMLKSFERLSRLPIGVNPESVLTARMEVSPRSARAFFQELMHRLATLPGVLSVGLSNCYPLSGSCTGTKVMALGSRDVSHEAGPGIGLHTVSPDYFKAMQIPLIRGRWFSGSESDQSPRVVVISESAARRYWPGEDPIGKSIGLGVTGWEHAEVIGVVGDVRYGGLDQPPQPDAYICYLQSPAGTILLFVRTASDPLALAGPLRREARAVNANWPVYDVTTMNQRISDVTARPRFSTTLLTAFAAIAFALAGLGIYSVVSYQVRHRMREFGIRIALGARGQDVWYMVVRRAVVLATAGIVIGLAGAFTANRSLRALLHEVSPGDPTTYLATAAVLWVLPVAASYLPARRACRVDPCDTLRME